MSDCRLCLPPVFATCEPNMIAVEGKSGERSGQNLSGSFFEILR